MALSALMRPPLKKSFRSGVKNEQILFEPLRLGKS